LVFGGCINTNKENKAYKYHKDGNYDSAIVMWQELINENLQSAKYLNNLGWAYMQNGELDKAEEYLELANEKAEISSTISSIQINRKLLRTIKDIPILFENKEFEKCLDYINDLEAQTSKNDFIKTYEARCLFEIGEIEKSYFIYNEILEKYNKRQSENRYSIEATKMIDLINEIE
jgi:tetratricopeptide (TPR) repeat protein